MKKKLIVIMMAAILASTMTAFAAAEDTADAVQEAEEEIIAEETETEAETDADSEAVDVAEEETADILGYYVVNYSQASTQVNLNIISDVDLLATAQQAGTIIYDFREDGTYAAYSDGKVTEGTYAAEEGILNMESSDGDKVEATYEVVDNLLIVREGETSSVFYDFDLVDMDYITIEDYETIEIDEAEVEVTEDTVEAYINSVLQGQTTYEQVTEGTVEDGDIVTISYVGVLDGEEEAFEGGTSEGLTVQLGSGALIDGFEEQLVGQEIGSTVEVQVTFPEDYTQIEGLAGQDAVFTTNILYKTVITTPELTDEWVQEFSEAYLPETFETVEDFRTYSESYLQNYYLHSAMLNALAAKTQISGYNNTLANLLVNYSALQLSANASYYGMDEDSYAAAYGYESAAAYEQSEAVYDLNISMIVNKVMKDLNLTYTQDDLDAALQEYLKETGYAATYTLDEYKEQAGTVGVWIYTNLEFKYNLAMSALEDRVVLTEHVDTDAEAETAEAIAEE